MKLQKIHFKQSTLGIDGITNTSEFEIFVNVLYSLQKMHCDFNLVCYQKAKYQSGIFTHITSLQFQRTSEETKELSKVHNYGVSLYYLTLSFSNHFVYRENWHEFFHMNVNSGLS